MHSARTCTISSTLVKANPSEENLFRLAAEASSSSTENETTGDSDTPTILYSDCMDTSDSESVDYSSVDHSDSESVDYDSMDHNDSESGENDSETADSESQGDNNGASQSIGEEQSVFLTSLLQRLVSDPDAIFFRNPVDTIKMKVPNHHDIIQSPMHLSTIRGKLTDSAYSSIEAIVSDFNLILQNSIEYNGEQHRVTSRARNLKSLFLREMEQLPGLGMVELE